MLLRVHVECTVQPSPASDCTFTSTTSDAGRKGHVNDEATCRRSCLTEKDIPGTSLNGRDLVVLTISQLKCWCKKADLVARGTLEETNVHVCICMLCVLGRRLKHYIYVCVLPC